MFSELHVKFGSAKRNFLVDFKRNRNDVTLRFGWLMKREMFTETSASFNHLTRLVVLEDLICFIIVKICRFSSRIEARESKRVYT